MNIIIFTACRYQNNLIRNRLLVRGLQYAKIASHPSEVELLIDMPPNGFYLDDSEECLHLIDNIKKGNHSACSFSAVTVLSSNVSRFLAGKCGAHAIIAPVFSNQTIDDTLSQYLEQASDKEPIIRRLKAALVQWEFPQSRIDGILNPHTGVR